MVLSIFGDGAFYYDPSDARKAFRAVLNAKGTVHDHDHIAGAEYETAARAAHRSYVGGKASDAT
jgi:hypothetical protein